MTPLLFAETWFSWLPAFTPRGFVVLAVTCALIWVVVRMIWGASRVRGRLGLVLLRCCSMILIGAILMGPTIVDETAGDVSRPALLYVLDGSQSMKLGREESRWEQSLQFIQKAEAAAGIEDSQNCQAFRFGHQLEPLTDDAGDGPTASLPAIMPTAEAATQNAGLAPPEASDSRLADALRQLLPQVSAASTSGVILLSDGRVRASDTVEQLAQLFGDADVPLHVVPTGQATGSGDVAIVSLVVPSKVRRFTENEAQVFIRSFGYTGKRTTVRIKKRSGLTNSETESLPALPVTLSGGAQSVSLTFRVDAAAEDFIVSVDPLADELTEKNNEVTTHVAINRTKVRVLYIEGQPNGARSILDGLLPSQTARPAGSLNVRAALQEDDDIECTMLTTAGGSRPQIVYASGADGGGFPSSRAELFAYDCVVFSNVGPDVIGDRQARWLAQWVEGRGGGLILCGSDSLNRTAWEKSPLEPLLPISLDKVTPKAEQSEAITVSRPQHPIWRLRQEELPNQELLTQIPPLQVSLSGATPKPTAETLAVSQTGAAPAVVAHRAGRGRVLTCVGQLGGPALSTLATTWGPQPERVAAKFWRNMVYWVTEGSSTGRRRLVAESDKRFYRPGDELNIGAVAYDEGARRTQKYRVWAMFEPSSLEDMSIYSPLLWPEHVTRESGEVGPRIAWGEELQLTARPDTADYAMQLQMTEAGNTADRGFRIEMTAYEGEESNSGFGHGTQVDSTSLAVQILSDPFEQQNPLPNHELLHRVAAISGGSVLTDPQQLAELLGSREVTAGPARQSLTPAWSRWWLWSGVLVCLTCEWVWRRLTGLA